MRPSITVQLDAQLIPNDRLKQSPRNYNPSICAFNGRVWMAYRSHRMDRVGEGRCGVAICETAPLIKEQVANSQWLDLGGATGKEHHEDPRLFLFQGKMHIAFIETTFPLNRNYIAVQKYARLEHTNKGWKVAEVFRPHYGDNYADKQEKNWQFMEKGGQLYAIYSSEPFVILRLAGDQVVEVIKRGAIQWPWGEVRGGSPPLRWGNLWLSFFHSSTPAIEGAWRRYWMGAITFDDNFNLVQITHRPLASGSEADDHGHDPRVGSNWKPYVVFPGGAVPTEAGWDVSLGINDWRCALARIPTKMLADSMQSPTAPYPPRYFRTRNGSRPTRMMRMDRALFWVNWDTRPTQNGSQPGFLMIDDPYLAEELCEVDGVSEITKAEYESRFSIKKMI